MLHADFNNPFKKQKLKKIIKWVVIAFFILIVVETVSRGANVDRISGSKCGGVADLKCPSGYSCSRTNVCKKSF